MAGSSKETPMMQQYWRYREKVPGDALLLFRLGDFYEMFHDDAKRGAETLGITLTQRSGYPMAGIPFAAAQTYITRLLEAGVKVAIVDQVETPKPGKLVERGLTRILTPGTRLEENQLSSRDNHYLMAIQPSGCSLVAAWLDLSTGEFRIASKGKTGDLLSSLFALSPREILIPASFAERPKTGEWDASSERSLVSLLEQHPVTPVPDEDFDAGSGYSAVCDTLGVLGLEGFGVARDDRAIGAAGALLRYATENLCAPPENLSTLKPFVSEQTLVVDPATLRNLEIFRNSSGQRTGSLLEAMDATVTAAGGRLLESYLAEPCLDIAELARRQDTVEALLGHSALASRLREELGHTRDVARILARLQNRIRNPREIGAIRDTLAVVPRLREIFGSSLDSAITQLGEALPELRGLREQLETRLSDELPTSLSEGGVIRDGVDGELDRLRELTRGGKSWLNALETSERESTGIKNLKIKYNGAFGYFIEVSKANQHLVPEHYVRRQTMVNAERYVTEELRSKEREIGEAEERALAREDQLFNEIVQATVAEAEALRSLAKTLAEADLFVAWAHLAREWDYCRPSVEDAEVIEIVEGRHPVVEQQLRRERHGMAGTHSFVPNDTFLASSSEQIALITGPNMAGKSTYIRQVALVTLMAHTGSFVPAKSCRIALTDRIFSRVGASDELARGNSTFMVEMNETANILNNATEKSLIILDEIGRGTSTYDGLAIAWSVIEFLHGLDGTKPADRFNSAGPKTLFATHYHEVTRLEQRLPRLRNYSVSVKEWNDQIVFVRQVLPGAADRSYGIQVARLAGLPVSVIERARSVLSILESEGMQGLNVAEETLANTAVKARNQGRSAQPSCSDKSDPAQLQLF